MANSKFQSLVTVTNQVEADFNGARDTCVLTSFALHDVLQRLGYNSRPLPIEAAVFPDDRKFIGTILGGWRELGYRRAARPGMWWGHLAVAVKLMRSGLCCTFIEKYTMARKANQ
jgi:hypothetical protein